MESERMALLKITTRDKLGTRFSRRLREQGLVPGVIYGHGEPTLPVTLSLHEIELAVHHGERLLKADLNGNEQNFLVKEVQYDHMGQSILHVDLTRVSLDERVKVTVPILLRGTPVGVEAEEGVLAQNLKSLSVECLVTAIPDDIRVPVAHLHVNDVLRVADLQLPEGIKALDDPDMVVASVTLVAEEVVAAPAEGAAAAAEPEVIGAKPEEEAEGQEEPEKPKKEKDKEKEKE
jgi:large subunit ribosomal protein L25